MASNFLSRPRTQNKAMSPGWRLKKKPTPSKDVDAKTSRPVNNLGSSHKTSESTQNLTPLASSPVLKQRFHNGSTSAPTSPRPPSPSPASTYGTRPSGVPALPAHQRSQSVGPRDSRSRIAKVPYKRTFKGGRSGGRQRLLDEAVAVASDQAAGERIAIQEMRSTETTVRDKEPRRIGNLLPLPRPLFYRSGSYATPLRSVEWRSLFYVVLFGIIVGRMVGLYLNIESERKPVWIRNNFGHIVLTFEEAPPLTWLQLFGAVFEPLFQGLVIAIGVVTYKLLERFFTVSIVDYRGFFTDLTLAEEQIRRAGEPEPGRFVSFKNWRYANPSTDFPDPDRLDSSVYCAQNFVLVDRREVYGDVDRTVTVYVSLTLANTIAAERFGVLRGKSFDEGRRILQMYADTQNHTQIDLSMQLYGSATSVAENTVEYLCLLRMAEAGDSTSLKGVEARCFQ